MLKIHICDDDTFYLEKVRQLLASFAEQNQIEADISVFSSMEELEREVLEGEKKPDLLFLDIEFGEENSIGFAKRLNVICPSCAVAFLTNHISYATDVYDTDHFYYILKDELEDRLENILKRFYDRTRKIFVRAGTKEWCFDTGDVIYIERSRRSCYVQTTGDRERLTIGFESVLPMFSMPMFLRCHNSFLINLNHVRVYKKDSFLMTNEEQVAISRSYRESCREKFLKWQEIWV